MTTQKQFNKTIKAHSWMAERFGWRPSVHMIDGDDIETDFNTQYCTMFTKLNWKYLEARIYVVRDQMEKQEEWETERDYIHEMMHLLLSPIEHEDSAAEEHVASSLSHIIMKLIGKDLLYNG